MTMKFSTREKVIFSLCIIMGLVFIIYRGLYQPLHQADQRLDDRITQARHQLSSALRVIDRTKSLSRQDTVFLQDFNQTNSDEKELSNMLADIEGLAGNNHLTIADIKTRKRKTDDYNNLTLSLTMSGNMPDILHFIYTLQKQPRWYAMDEMDIRPQGGHLHCRLVVTRSLVL